jgi:hypothetical protein
VVFALRQRQIEHIQLMIEQDQASPRLLGTTNVISFREWINSWSVHGKKAHSVNFRMVSSSLKHT